MSYGSSGSSCVWPLSLFPLLQPNAAPPCSVKLRPCGNSPPGRATRQPLPSTVPLCLRPSLQARPARHGSQPRNKKKEEASNFRLCRENSDPCVLAWEPRWRGFTLAKGAESTAGTPPASEQTSELPRKQGAVQIMCRSASPQLVSFFRKTLSLGSPRAFWLENHHFPLSLGLKKNDSVKRERVSHGVRFGCFAAVPQD